MTVNVSIPADVATAFDAAMQAGGFMGFDYHGEHRTVQPHEFLTGKNGNVVLAGVEPEKGWRRYNVDEIENLVV